MALSIPAVQSALKEDGLDGWVLYDFHGSNPIARRLTGLDMAGKMTTRRWYYVIPASGEPQKLVHAIEPFNLDHLPGGKTIYSQRDTLASGLAHVLGGLKRVAMEYSPGNAIPYISRVDAGTVEAVRKTGAEVVSSGDLVQRFEAVWSADALTTHRTASDALYRIKDRAFNFVRDARKQGRSLTELDVQSAMTGWFGDEGLVTDAPPVVAAQENAGNPHYMPTAARPRAIGANEVLLLDLWGKLPQPGAVFADITWVGFTADQVPERYVRAFNAARDARDAAVTLVQDAVSAGRELRGYEVDRACRAVIERAGFGSQFIHRTGHSLGTEVHGNGVHMDDYETHDERRLIPGTGFTIEPGVYGKEFGVRTEINMFIGEREATVSGPLQREFVLL
ncbi:MAG TPA: M24 family metallopeptidase [Vicinamibacterales bacterium]|nr:M24 family metallopeptidase [Vicinamibacterales bacterium]